MHWTIAIYTRLQNLTFAAPYVVHAHQSSPPAVTTDQQFLAHFGILSLFSFALSFYLLIFFHLFQDEICFSLFLPVKVDAVNYIWCSII